MLVVMHDGYIQRFLQSFLDIEAFRCFDVLKVDTAEGWSNLLHSFAELLWVFLIYFNIEHVNTTINLKKQSFTFHHGLAAHRTDVTQSEHGGAIADDRDQVTFIGISIRIVGVLLNLQTRESDSWRIGQTQICLCAVSLGGFHLNLTRSAILMIGEGSFFRNLNHKCILY